MIKIWANFDTLGTGNLIICRISIRRCRRPAEEAAEAAEAVSSSKCIVATNCAFGHWRKRETLFFPHILSYFFFEVEKNFLSAIWPSPPPLLSPKKEWLFRSKTIISPPSCSRPPWPHFITMTASFAGNKCFVVFFKNFIVLLLQRLDRLLPMRCIKRVTKNGQIVWHCLEQSRRHWHWASLKTVAEGEMVSDFFLTNDGQNSLLIFSWRGEKIVEFWSRSFFSFYFYNCVNFFDDFLLS